MGLFFRSAKVALGGAPLFLMVVGCGHSIEQPPLGTATAGTTSGNAGAPSNTPGGAGGAMMSCGDSALPAEKTRPGYTAPRDPGVAEILSSIAPSDKIKQLYGVDNPSSRDSAVYRDIERSYDVPSGTGKTLRGFRYRDAGRGVNLAAGQDNRPTQGNDFATAFPTESARAASWDVDLEYQIGEAAGEETMTSNNDMLLAPCMNIIRHPYWGRTQETYSEDMFHTGRMASALTAGIQQHVIACAKHFAANNIENGRANQNAQMNEQTLREIYGRHFEMVVQDGGIGCVMASYNSINGVKSTENQHLLTDILRTDFGFRGIVLSDWWAMPGDQDTPDTAAGQTAAIQAMKAGLDIELPWNLHYAQLPAVVSAGALAQPDIDAAAGRVLEQKFRFQNAYTDQPWGLGTETSTLSGDSLVNESHLALAEEAEIRSAVLLDNGLGGSPVLPIPAVQSIAVVGLDLAIQVSGQTELPKSGSPMHFATDANIGDRGSSRVNADPATSIGPFAGIRSAAAVHGISNVTSGNSVDAARTADFIVVVVGLSAGDEGEEYSLDSFGDRTSLDLPSGQNQFVNDVLALGKPTAIIVESGSIVNLPWRAHANRNQATIWAGYPGQRGGNALGKLLLGDRNFSGKMPLAWPKQEDLQPFRAPSGNTTQMGYFFGYRDYDNRAAQGNPVDLVYPFGHGLSYSSFVYSNLAVPCAEVSKNAVIQVTVDVSNTSGVDGEEVVMLFVSGPPKPASVTGDRPVKELKGFSKVKIAKQSTEHVTIPLRVRDLRHWEGDENGSWLIDDGEYSIKVGPSGADSDLKQIATLDIHG